MRARPGNQGSYSAHRQQGAIRRTVSKKLDPSLNAASFAYREGLGALRAVNRLLEHRDARREWVVRGDIEEFFPSVPHDLMLASLEPYFEPAALQFIASLLRVPIVDGAAASVLEVGLAQGDPLSPLLANFYLNPFDHALSQPPAGLVRFADDFALAVPSARLAGELLERAETILVRLRLRLNPNKTRILSFEQGFDFLGFRFQGRSVRVSPERIAEFKAHLEHLLNPRFGSGTAQGVKEANDLIRGWRNYFQLGQVAEDFRLLDQWMQDRFGAKAADLERLVPEKPHRRPPALGGYEGRPRPRSEAPVPVPAANPSVERDPNGKPLQVRRAEGWVQVAALAPLAYAAVSGLVAELKRAAIFHMGSAANWDHPMAAEAVAACAGALRGRLPPQAARAAYEVAFLAVAAADPRAPRGVLRRALRMEAWAALLEQGLDLGPEAGSTGEVPALAGALAEALEPLTTDFALLQALRLGQGRHPLVIFQRALGFQVAYRGAHLTWRRALRLEAAELARCLRNGAPYRAHLWRAQ